MLLNLTKSKLFTHEPDIRFAKEFSVPEGTWKEAWKRHILMGYTPSEVREYITVKTGRRPSDGSICRWIQRTRIYILSAPLVKKGVVHANSEIFGVYEEYVIKEMTKHLKSGASKNPKTII